MSDSMCHLNNLKISLQRPLGWRFWRTEIHVKFIYVVKRVTRFNSYRLVIYNVYFSVFICKITKISRYRWFLWWEETLHSRLGTFLNTLYTGVSIYLACIFFPTTNTFPMNWNLHKSRNGEDPLETVGNGKAIAILKGSRLSREESEGCSDRFDSAHNASRNWRFI